MTDTNAYDAATALTSYYTSRTATRPARLWAIEKLAQDLAELGIIELFEGPGTDPTALDGYAVDKLWLQVSDGVTDEPGTLRAYDGAGSASSISNWPAMSVDAFRSYLTGGQIYYAGTWNASTGVATLVDGSTRTLAGGTGTKGELFEVSASGSTDLDGITDWSVGDEFHYTGSAWKKIGGGGASGSGDVVGPSSSTAARLARFKDTTGKEIEDSGVSVSTDGTFAGNSDALIPTQKAVKAYADSLIAANDAMVYKGVVDCSTNPNYPAADRGHTYRVSVAGKIGGGSGINVEAGDILLCLTDSTSSGNHATVGAQWNVIQANLDGAITTSSIGVSVQAYNALLTAIAALSMVSDRFIYGTGASTVALGTITSAGRALIDDADAAAQRTTLGLGTAATLSTAQAQQEVIVVAVSDESTAITTGTAKVTFRMPFAMTLTGVRASLSTASNSGNPAIDINEGGVSIFSTTLTIDANEKTSTTAATAAVLSDTSLADDAEMTIDIDTAGTGAKGLKIYLIGNRT